MSPRFTIRDFIKSVDPETPYLYYVISQPAKFGTHLGPAMDFEVDLLDGTGPKLFTITRGFYDRGVQCIEYRPAEWMDHYLVHNLRIRFYSPGVEWRDSYARGDEAFKKSCLPASCKGPCKKAAPPAITST